MKEETIEKIEDEIVKKTTMPENLKGKVRKEIFANIILAIGIIIYFIFLVLGSLDTTKEIRSVDLKIFSIILLFTSIILFEIAYKKDSGKLALNGIEVLIVSIITLFLPYIVFELDKTYQKYYILSSSIIAIYYIIKAIVIANKAKIIYEKKESDINEITKKENKKDSILDEEIEEIEKIEDTKEEKELQSKDEIDKIKEIEEKNNEKKTKTNKKEKNTTETKKRGRPKKETTTKTEKLSTTKSKNTKKQDKNDKKNNEKKDTQKSKTTTKKRGRPRKVVSE